MPNIKSAIKRVKVTSVKSLQNKMNKSFVKTVLKKFDTACQTGNKTEAESTLRLAFKTVDRAASRGILHKNTAARRKSRMAKKLNSLA